MQAIPAASQVISGFFNHLNFYVRLCWKTSVETSSRFQRWQFKLSPLSTDASVHVMKESSWQIKQLNRLRLYLEKGANVFDYDRLFPLYLVRFFGFRYSIICPLTKLLSLCDYALNCNFNDACVLDLRGQVIFVSINVLHIFTSF